MSARHRLLSQPPRHPRRASLAAYLGAAYLLRIEELRSAISLLRQHLTSDNDTSDG